MPTLTFTPVLAAILRERFDINDTMYGTLLVYAAISTALPSSRPPSQWTFTWHSATRARARPSGAKTRGKDGWIGVGVLVDINPILAQNVKESRTGAENLKRRK